ncbi:MAG: uroporphyrinogen-III synthase, partial [Ferrimonas sp.]
MTLPERPHLLLTRPAGRGAALMQRLQAHGIQVTPHPLVQIVPLSGISTASLLQADAAFFVSQTAVHLVARQLNAPWPKIPCFAVGRSTAMALEQYGAKAIYPTAGQETREGVLAFPQWHQLQQAKI